MNFDVEKYIQEHNKTLSNLDLKEVDIAINLIHEKAKEGKLVAVCGNGGSASCASHYITDWNKNIHHSVGRPFNGICLSDNIGLITAYANDVSYEDIFSEQVKSQMQKDDLLITVSGSGNSPNVVKATQVANELGVTTLSICGYSGGTLKELSDYSVWINSNDMQICEDIHLVFGHMVMRSICNSVCS